MIQAFKKFILRGNVVDLAVAVVIGGAFGAVITALVADMITPLISALGGQPDFSALTFTLNGSKFMYGDFLNAVLAFLIIAAVLFFFIVQPLNHLQDRAARRKTPEEPTERKCPECFSEIPKQATRCRFCTAKIPAIK